MFSFLVVVALVRVLQLVTRVKLLAMATHGTIGEYDYSKDWVLYCERLEHYFAANDVNDATCYLLQLRLSVHVSLSRLFLLQFDSLIISLAVLGVVYVHVCRHGQTFDSRRQL